MDNKEEKIKEDKKIKELEKSNNRLREIIDEQNKQKHIRKQNTNIYYGIRFIQVLCIGVAVFGGLWKGTEVMNLDTPEFMIVYGGAGALISEIVARVFKKKIIK